MDFLGTSVDLNSGVLVCDLCQARFISRDGLNKHMNSKHLKKQPFTCPVCGQGFSVRELFLDHQNKHRNIKAHCCPFCSNRFTYKTSLRQHIRERNCKALKSSGTCSTDFVFG